MSFGNLELHSHCNIFCLGVNQNAPRTSSTANHRFYKVLGQLHGPLCKQPLYVRPSMFMLAIKVCICYSITFLYQTSIIDWYAVQWGSKNKQHKYTCLEEIGLHLQFVLTTPHSNSKHNKICIQLRNQQTCTTNKSITKSGEVQFLI